MHYYQFIQQLFIECLPCAGDIPDMGSSGAGGKIPDNIQVGVGIKTELANR